MGSFQVTRERGRFKGDLRGLTNDSMNWSTVRTFNVEDEQCERNKRSKATDWQHCQMIQ